VKVRTSVKKICSKCKVIRRAGVVRVICENPEAQAAPGLRGTDQWLESPASTCPRTSAWKSA